MAKVDIGILITARDRITGPFRRIRQEFDKTERQARKTSRGLKAIDVVLSAIAVGAVLRVTTGFAKMGSEMENLRVRIGVFERDMSKVDGVMNRINDQFGQTPFALKTVGDTFVRLKASGLDPLDGSLKSLLDGVAAFGGGTSELQRAGIAIQQIAGKGVVSMEELRQQLGEAIPFAMRIMAQQMDQSVGELIQSIERGELSAQKGLTALFVGLEKTFGGISDAMVNTMSGAWQRVIKVFQAGADRIFNTLEVGPTIAASLQVLATSLEEIFNSITPQQAEGLKNFFTEFAILMQRLVVGGVVLAIETFDLLGKAIGLINTAIDKLIVSWAFLANLVSGREFKSFSEIEEIFNQTAGSAEGLRGVIDRLAEEAPGKIAEAIAKVQQVQDTLSLGKVNLQRQDAIIKGIDSLNASIAAADTLPYVQKIERARAKLNEFGMGLDQERERLDAIQVKLNEAFAKGDIDGAQRYLTQTLSLNQAIADGDKILGEYSATLGGLESKLQANFLDKVSRAVDKLGFKIQDFQAEATGSEFEQELTGIQRKYGAIEVDLQKQLETVMRTRIETEQRSAEIARIRGLINQNNQAEQQALALATRINEQKMITLRLQDTQFANQQAFINETNQIDLSRLNDPLASVFQSDFVDRARSQREQLRANIEQTRIQIQELEQQAVIEKDPDRLAAIRQRQEILRGSIPIMEQLRASTTATALASQQLWQSVGETLKTSVADALLTITDRTKSLQDVVTNVFNSMTQAAARYLAELLLIKAASGAAGLGFGGGGAGFGGLLGGFLGGSARGNAFRGQITPFANGGIIGGPTLFGLAGEKGPEAIMPLQRGSGGKLGVAAQGAMSRNLHLTVNAIDPQTGAKFILDHLEDIQNGLDNEAALGLTGR